MRNVRYLARLLASMLILLHSTPATAAAPPKTAVPVITAAPATTVSSPGHKDRSNKPINVKADHLQVDNDEKKAVFTGRVIAVQDDITMYCDRLEVFYDNASDEVDKIIAIGNVRILQKNRVGTGGRAVYENKLGKITLTINPKVTQDNDTITGKVITYYTDEKTSIAESGDNTRVEALIHPKQRKKDDSQQH